jgi:hypothetical protein
VIEIPTMKALSKSILASGLLLLASYTATAQSQPIACAPAGKNNGVIMEISTRSGCPLSAVIEQEDVRTAADGTRVQTKMRTLIYRNSSGRIRIDTYNPTDKLGPDRPAITVIYDPDDGFVYPLETHPELDHVAPAKGSTVQLYPPPVPVWKSKPVFEQLGTREMEGLIAKGRRFTFTQLASADGNEPEITTVTEEWESPEMGIRLLWTTSRSDGNESVIRITNLQLAEPDPALFQVPAK